MANHWQLIKFKSPHHWSLVRAWGVLSILLGICFFSPGVGISQDKSDQTVPGKPDSTPISKPVLTQGVVCEKIENQRPINAGWVFPVAAKKIHCLTKFEHIAQTQFITHRWYFRDDPVATFRLALQPPIWSTFSSLQIREMDKGPWRVDIRDAQGQPIQSLRFSVSD